MDIRGKCSIALELVLNKEQNIKTIERVLYNNSDGEYDYIANVYEVINDIKSGVNLATILKNIKDAKTGWKHHSLHDIILEEEEQNNFIIQPFEVYEGVLTCKCGSKRVYSYQKQSRSADEPMSTYANCMACGNKWVYSG